jgi:hypothetical protein
MSVRLEDQLATAAPRPRDLRWQSLVARVVPVDLQNAENLHLPVTIGAEVPLMAPRTLPVRGSLGTTASGEGEFAVLGSEACFSDWKPEKQWDSR